MQEIITPSPPYAGLDAYFRRHQVTRLLLVCGSSMQQLPLYRYFSELENRCGIRVTPFSAFHPNPEWHSVQQGAALCTAHGCNGITAVGGGSAIDVAKCIWLEAGKPSTPLLAIPTTAGSGSETTSFAVVYKDGVKQSRSGCLPSGVLLDPELLRTLPEYQRKATLLDALCHGIESCWSVHATGESRGYAVQAIRQVLEHAQAYLANRDTGNAGMLHAANLAGRAINLARTTAAHAMSYQLTARCGIAHGHAAGLCLAAVFDELVDRSHQPEAPPALSAALEDIADAMGCPDPPSASEAFRSFLAWLQLPVPAVGPDVTPEALAATVNPERLANTPVTLDETTLCRLYRSILSQISH